MLNGKAFDIASDPEGDLLFFCEALLQD